MRRFRLAALVLPLAAALPLGTPPAGASQDFQAAANLRVKAVRHVGDNPGFHIVELLWDGPPRAACPGLRVFGHVEVRDADLGGPWETAQTHGDAPALFGPDYALGGFYRYDDQFLREGGTYEIRLSYDWQVFKPDVPEDIHVVSYSPLLQVKIETAEPVDPDAPTDVVAIADTKKPRVTITWKSDAPKGTEYAVERRKVGAVQTSKGGPKAEDDDFDVIDTVTVLKFLDRSVDPDSEYEYRIATLVDQTFARSKRDTVFTAGKCPRSAFQMWRGLWGRDFEDGSQQRFVFAVQDAEMLFLMTRNIPTIVEESFPLRLITRPVLTLAFTLRDEGLSVGGHVLPFGARGTLRAEMVHGDPFDADWLNAKMTLSFVDQKETYTTGAGTQFRLFEGDDDKAETTVCAAIGHGLGARSVPPGTRVAFAFQVVALGPAPLLPRELELDCTAEGGTFDSFMDAERIREIPSVPFVPGGTKARLEVGALGPVSPSKSEVGKIVLVATADGTRAKLRVRVRFLDALANHGQKLKFAQLERYADVGVGPPAAK